MCVCNGLSPFLSSAFDFGESESGESDEEVSLGDSPENQFIPIIPKVSGL